MAFGSGGLPIDYRDDELDLVDDSGDRASVDLDDLCYLDED